MADKTLASKEKFIERLQWMSQEKFQEVKKTDEYRALITDPEVKGQLQSMLANRRAKERKRVKFLETLYTTSEAMNWVKDIQDYRDLRVLQIVLGDDLADNDNKLWFSSLDKGRRECHNRALTAFCRLVLKTSPGTNRSNTPTIEGSSFGVRDESEGDLFAGPLMIPYEEANNYGTHDVRDAMTTGMFQFLILIEETDRSDWDIARGKALERISMMGKTVDEQKIPDIKQIQQDLISSRRARGAKRASPTKDDFDPDEIR